MPFSETRGSPPPSDGALLAAPSAIPGTAAVRVDRQRRILHVTICGTLTVIGGLEYRRSMLAAFDLLPARRPWGVLSDRRQATVQEDEVLEVMRDVFDRATTAGRTHAAVLASNPLTQLQMRRLAVHVNLVQKHFVDEAQAVHWLLRELG